MERGKRERGGGTKGDEEGKKRGRAERERDQGRQHGGIPPIDRKSHPGSEVSGPAVALTSL